jgi:predicted kinase
MPTLTILLGVPGSGKTTIAKGLQKEDPQLVRVCRDNIRQMLFNGKYTPENEKIVKEVQFNAVVSALNAGRPVVVDDAGNLKPEIQKRFSYLADTIGAELIIDDRLLAVPVEECIRRDLARPNSVGEAVIRKFAAYYLPEPTIKGDPTKPHIVIVDVDNCLADPGDRPPFAYDQAGSDGVYVSVARILFELPDDTDIAIVTGRDESGRAALINWLERNMIAYTSSDLIFMRAIDDRRSGAEVKAEALEKIFQSHFPVLAIDDDPTAIAIYKAAGIPTLLVANTAASQVSR